MLAKATHYTITTNEVKVNSHLINNDANDF